jgi:hypothetical protein
MGHEHCDILVGTNDCGARRLEPVTLGVPFPDGFCVEVGTLELTDPSGAVVPLQTRVLDRWPSGSARWALLDFQVNCRARTIETYRLRVAPSSRVELSRRLSVCDDRGAVRVDTGAASFWLSCGNFPFERVQVGDDAMALNPVALHVEEHAAGGRHPFIDAIVVEEAGPLRACTRLSGGLGDRREPLVELTARLHFFAGSSSTRLSLTLRNPRRADHPGGIWELGSRGSVFLREVALTYAWPDPRAERTIHYSVQLDHAPDACTGPFELYQDSSGGEQWRSLNHTTRRGDVPHTFRGYRLRCGDLQTSGLRATPAVAVRSAGREVAIACQYFWQNFPKALEVADDGVKLALFPRQFADVQELQGGEQKTDVVYTAFGRDTVTDHPLDWTRRPLFVRCTPAWYSASGAMPYLIPEAEDPHAQYVSLVNTAIQGEHAFVRTRELIDEYGWRNFGEIYANHEAVFHTGASRLISHYNNQYDAAAGMALHFMRSGDERWRALFDELTAHVLDIDIYHTVRDKSAYNGGLFWHTHHYLDAGKSTHRSYPRAPGVQGGGPSNEHNYSTGLMLRYFMTGDPAYREAVIGLARWVLDMDDGRKTVVRWLARGHTGLASASGTPTYHGPGRGAAYSIVSLLNAHRLTGETAYVEKAEQLIRRCIHPNDAIAARNLLDAERRWYYTVFLQALGQYLDYKAVLGQLDRMYAYARESLLQYARWMATHEYPYLEKPEILEYPTETWAALDMRKSDVFNFAAKHAIGDERRQFRERADFFFHYSSSTLTRLPTGTLARPIVLMLSSGAMHGWFARHAEAGARGAAGEANDFGVPEAFVPQKVTAKRRVIALLVLFACLAGVFAAAWLVAWPRS